MKVTLAWNGPVGAGLFPSDPTKLEEMFQPGVYLRLKSYDRGRTISYVGQSKSLLSRIDQHVTNLLSLQTALRDGTGEVWMRGGFEDRLQCYRDIDTAARMAAEEAARMRFYWAACDDDSFYPDHLSVVEAALKLRLERNVEAANGLSLNENQQGISVGTLDEPVSIDSDFSALESTARVLLTDLLGDDPIVYDDNPEGADVEADIDG